MVTIADVASKAGVGAGTVSRVLNNSPQVSAPTRSRVLAAIEKLNYRPNPLAQGLSRGRCQTLGVIVPFFTQPSAVERLRGVVTALDESKYDLVLFNVESTVHRDEHFDTLTRRDRADGLLVISLKPPARRLARIVAAGVPVVLVDARGAGVPMIITDDVEGGRMATRHLLALGHELVAFIGDEPRKSFGFTSSADRETGYREILRDAGLTVVPQFVRYGPHDRRAARRLTEHLLALKEPPTAVFASSDVQALGVLDAAQTAGLHVPDDLSVVGFDDIEISAYAGITTVRQPLFESGRQGARVLLEIVTGATAKPRVRQLPLELVARASTGPPRRRRPRRARRARPQSDLVPSGPSPQSGQSPPSPGSQAVG